jgi:DNA-binding LacI/PurR family transcriptional regulator
LINMVSQVSNIALYEKLEGVLREKYLCDPVPGFRLPSERELAREFGVSVPTLRKAIDRLVVEGALERRRGSGTFVAEAGSHAAVAKPMGVICNVDLSKIPHPGHLLQTLSDCRHLLRDKGYRIRVYLGDEVGGLHPEYEVPPEFLSDIRNDVLGGVIALGTFPVVSWTEPLEKNRVPVVGLGELHRNMATENHMIFLIKAAQRLLSLGRKRVAYIQSAPFQESGKLSVPAGKSQVYDDQTVHCLLEGFGLKVKKNWYRTEWRIDSPGAGWSALREIWSEGGEDRPDGLIAGNPMLAEDICLAARECGISVPRDLVIVGSWLKDSVSPPPNGMEAILSDVRKISENLVDMLDEAVRTGAIQQSRRIVNCLDAQTVDADAAEDSISTFSTK